MRPAFAYLALGLAVPGHQVDLIKRFENELVEVLHLLGVNAGGSLDEGGGLCKVNGRLSPIKGNVDRIQLLEVRLEFLRDIDVPVLRQVPAPRGRNSPRLQTRLSAGPDQFGSGEAGEAHRIGLIKWANRFSRSFPTAASSSMAFEGLSRPQAEDL